MESAQMGQSQAVLIGDAGRSGVIGTVRLERTW
jgi:hypothetical protein